MKWLDDQLLAAITNMYQIESHGRQPNQYVYVVNRFYGQPNDIFKVKRARLPGVLSVETNWSSTSTAGSFTIVVQNKDGLLSPDYVKGKIPSNRVMRGHLESPWRGQLQQNTEIHIHWGFGEYMVRELTGLIDEVEINARNQTMTIRGRSMKKLLIDNTIAVPPGQTHLFPNKATTMDAAFSQLCALAGVTLRNTLPFVEPESSEVYVIEEPFGKRGEHYYELMNPMLESCNMILFENPDGTCDMRYKEKVSMREKPDYTIDDQMNMTDLDYNIKDTELFGTLLVEATNNAIDVFSSKYISTHLLNGHRREKVVKYPWATTQAKRRLAASSEFLNMLHDHRTITTTILANPALQLWDTVRIQERISTAQQNYHIKGLHTTQSASGFTQRLECPSNMEFQLYSGSLNDLPTNVTPDVTTAEKELRLLVWDMGAMDFDIIDIYLNGTLVEGGIVLKEEPQSYTLNLEKAGAYTIKFVGVSAGDSGTLHFGYSLQDKDNQPLHAYASIEFERVNLSQYGYYQNGKRPSKSVVIHKNG